MNFNSTKIKLIITIASLTLFVLIIIPVLAYYLNFSGESISKKPSDWAFLGDYIGGVVNTIISFFSLVILGFITWQIGRSSTEQEKLIKEYDRKVEAFDHMMSSIEEFYTVYEKEKRELLDIDAKYVKSLAKQNGITHFDKDRFYTSISSLQISLMDFYSVIKHFHLRFSHFFNYDFNNPYYEESRRSLNKSTDSIKIELDSLIGSSAPPKMESIDQIQTAIDCLYVVSNQLKEEIIKKP